MNKLGVKKNHKLLLTGLCLLVVIFVVSLIPVGVRASSPPTPDAASTPVPQTINITGYRLSHNDNWEYKGPITTNMSLTIELTIHDERLEGPISRDTLAPVARLNTGSFRVTSNTSIVVPEDPKPATKGFTYRVIFYNLEYTGTGNTFQCDILYNAFPTLPIHTYTLTLNQCVEYVPPSSSSDTSSSSSAIIKGTGFVLKSASFGNVNVQAGEVFTLSAELLATNGQDAVENVTVGVTPPKEISLASGSSLVYVGTVKPGQTVPVSFELIPAANVENGSYTVVVDIKGVNARTGEAVSASVNFSIPVIQPERFEIFNTQLPASLVANSADGMGFGTVTLVNQGKGTVSNVSVDIVGEGITTEDGKQYLGHIAGGEQKSADFNLMASVAGQIDCQVVVTYESVRGEKKTLTYDFTVLVEDMGDPGMMGDMSGFPMEPMPEPKGGIPAFVWIIIGVVVVAAGVVVTLIVIKKRKAKKAAQELEYLGDEDEDI